MNTKDAPLFLRCDSTSQIGTGHIMRCIALAQAWQDEGGKVIFISHCESEKLRERILKEGFDLILINYPHPHPSDLEQTLSTINNFSHFSFHHSAPWLVLDGYHFTPEYQKVIRDAGIRLLVIDDMNHLPYYHADIILNQNIYAGDLKYNCDSNTKLLLGTKYVLLRREFLKYRDFKREIPEKAKKILVTMGGADPDNVTSKVIQALNLLNDSELEVKIIIGPSNPHVESIRNELALSSFNFHLLHSVDDDMPALMAWADLAISGAGSTVWELVFMGLPIITIAVAENQKQVAEKLHSIGIAYNLGWHADIFPEQISQSLSNFITNCKLFTDKNTIAKNTIDGDGINRILMRLNLKKIRLRQVTENDCELIWRWANDPDVRNSAFNSDPIPWETHKCWFSKKLKDPNCIMFLAIDENDNPVGQIRFDIDENKFAEIDVSVDKLERGKGFGSSIITSAVERVIKIIDLKAIYARVKLSNSVSIKAFKKAGFEVKETKILFNQPVVQLIWRLNE